MSKTPLSRTWAYNRAILHWPTVYVAQYLWATHQPGDALCRAAHTGGLSCNPHTNDPHSPPSSLCPTPFPLDWYLLDSLLIVCPQSPHTPAPFTIASAMARQDVIREMCPQVVCRRPCGSGGNELKASCSIVLSPVLLFSGRTSAQQCSCLVQGRAIGVSS